MCDTTRWYGMLEHKQFARETKGAAQKAADDWWAKQNGLTRVTAYVGPSDLAEQIGARWLATIIYEAR